MFCYTSVNINIKLPSGGIFLPGFCLLCPVFPIEIPGIRIYPGLIADVAQNLYLAGTTQSLILQQNRSSRRKYDTLTYRNSTALF